MIGPSLRIGTRGSALALAQTQLVVDALRAASPEPIAAEIVTIRTAGDRVTDRPFDAIGAKGVFARELQRALSDGEVDLAVHSLKDLPGVEPDGLTLAAVVDREDPRDVLVSGQGRTIDELPPGAVVGTSSSRRRALVAVERPDLEVTLLRGNVGTRLDRVRDGEMDAAILAAAGLSRLGLQAEVAEYLDPRVFVPPPGQGAVVVEVRSDRLAGDLAWVASAEDHAARRAVDAERVFMQEMEGGCEVPLGAWARPEGGDLRMDVFVATPDGSVHLRDAAVGDDPVALGLELVERLRAAGADRILEMARR